MCTILTGISSEIFVSEDAEQSNEHRSDVLFNWLKAQADNRAITAAHRHLPLLLANQITATAAEQPEKTLRLNVSHMVQS